MKLSTKMALGLSMLFAAAVANAGMKPSKEVRFVGDVNYSTFCKAAVEDNVTMLKRALTQKVGDVAPSRRAVLKKLVAEDGMSCDGFSLVEFSKQRGAQDVYAFLTQAS